MEGRDTENRDVQDSKGKDIIKGLRTKSYIKGHKTKCCLTQGHETIP